MTELALCEHVYHCTPSMLDEQDAETIDAHLLIMNVEAGMKKVKTVKRNV